MDTHYLNKDLSRLVSDLKWNVRHEFIVSVGTIFELCLPDLGGLWLEWSQRRNLESLHNSAATLNETSFLEARNLGFCPGNLVNIVWQVLTALSEGTLKILLSDDDLDGGIAHFTRLVEIAQLD